MSIALGQSTIMNPCRWSHPPFWSDGCTSFWWRKWWYGTGLWSTVRRNQQKLSKIIQYIQYRPPVFDVILPIQSPFWLAKCPILTASTRLRCPKPLNPKSLKCRVARWVILLVVFGSAWICLYPAYTIVKVKYSGISQFHSTELLGCYKLWLGFFTEHLKTPFIDLMGNTILVGGLEHVLFFHILGISSSQLTNSYFSERWVNHQPA